MKYSSIKTLLILASLFVLATNAFGATSISQFGITWQFDKDYETGQFANGDYYVIGPVNIVSISPRASGGRNGSQVNPYVGGSTGNPSNPNQPFDSRAYYYDSSELFTSGTLNPGDSLVSVISKDGSERTDWAGNNLSSNSFLRTSAVLTVLAQRPASLAFRPAYSGTDKTLYYVNQLNTSWLPNLNMKGIQPPSHSGFGTVEYFLRGLERPWTSMHGRDWTARNIAPEDNQFDYHEEIGFFLSETTLLLMTDWSTFDETNKTQLLYRYIQNCIDYYAVIKVPGIETSAVWAWPIVFGGLLLDDPDMYNFWINHPNTRDQRDHEKFYYIGDRKTSTTSSIVPEGQTWVGWKHPVSGKYPAFSKQVGEEYEHLHPSEWTCFAPHCKAEVYRAQHDVYPIIGLTLSSIIADASLSMDVNAMLAHNPIRDYADRWMSEGFMTKEYKNTGHTYLEEMEKYTDFTIYYYRYGTGGSPFVTEMWNTYRNIDGSAVTATPQGTTSPPSAPILQSN